MTMNFKERQSTKRELKFQIGEYMTTINQINNGNEVVIERWFNRYNYTMKRIFDEVNILITEYNRRFGKRWGNYNLY